MTELPFAKQPPAASVKGSGALASQLETNVEELATATGTPLTPLVDVQLAALELEDPSGLTVNPEQKGIEVWVPLKSEGFPKKSHRSELSPVPLKPLGKLRGVPPGPQVVQPYGPVL
jgi:hypothetical protein